MTTSKYTIVTLFLLAMITGCGSSGGGDGSNGGDGSGGGDSSELPPNDSASIAPQDLEGTWGGTHESRSTDQQFDTIEFEFDGNGDIASIVRNGTDQNVTGSYQRHPSDSGQLMEYTVDGDLMLLYVDGDAQHAGLVFDDGTIIVLEKGSTSGDFSVDDPQGSWSGRSVFVQSGPTEAGFDAVSGSYAQKSGSTGAESTDLTFANSDSSCENIEHDLPASGFDPSFGVFDTGTVQGGSGQDCPESTLPADAYMSYDGNFMVVYAGCEATNDVNDCSFVILSRD